MIPSRCFGLLSVCLFTIAGSRPFAATAAGAPKLAPKQAPRASPLSRDHDYLRAAPAPDFWALIPYYVPQANDAACSAASVAMVVNAAVRAAAPLDNDTRNITQEMLLDRVDVEHWKARLSQLGYFGQHGLTLAQLGTVSSAALHAFGVGGAKIEVVVADGLPAGLERFRAALTANERSRRDALVVHFVQDEVTEATGGPYPHISPVGAYDAASRRVLVLDVDREWYEPYWVADDVLFSAMSRVTPWFGAGGFVVARFDG